MKAAEAHKLTNASIRRRNLADHEKAWNAVMDQIKEKVNGGHYTLNVPKPEMTPAIRRRLKSDGYQVNECHPPQDPEDMRYVRVSWEKKGKSSDYYD